MISYRLILSVTFVLLCTFNVNAQQVGLALNGDVEILEKAEISRDTSWFLNQEERTKKLDQVKWQLFEQGYLQAKLYKSNADSLLDQYQIVAGKRYTLSALTINRDLLPWKDIENLTKEKILRPSKVKNSCMAILKQLENTGYPFAVITSQVHQATDSAISLHLSLELGTFYTYDSIKIVGSSKLSPTYLANYLNIKKGMPYNQQTVKQIDNLLDRLPLVKRKASTEVFYVYNTTVIRMHIDERNTDRFDGVVGFAPNSEVQENAGLLLTGEVNLDLKNIANRGISLFTGWKSYLAGSQDLVFKTSLPFILNTPLFIGAGAQITKFDSLFLDTRYDVQVGIFKGGNRQWSAKFGQTVSSLLSVDTLSIRQSAKLPANNPYQITRYGLGLEWNLLDRVANPTKGYLLHAEAHIGVRSLMRDATIDKVLFYSPSYPKGISIYDTIKRKQTRGEIALDQQLFIPTFKNATLVFRYLGQYIISPNVYFNELNRFGGFSTLRGFDERSIFATSFSMLNIEYRYLINSESFASVFVNGAYTENRFTPGTGSFSSLPFGFGASVQINTGKSLLQMSYALGGNEQIPLALRTAKIHFGLINYLK